MGHWNGQAGFLAAPARRAAAKGEGASLGDAGSFSEGGFFDISANASRSPHQAGSSKGIKHQELKWSDSR
jgi:hypothetical protein